MGGREDDLVYLECASGSRNLQPKFKTWPSLMLRCSLYLRPIGLRFISASVRTAPDDLVFSTPKGTPLSPQNLYNRVLAPACDAIRTPRVSWHSFRHSNATLLGEVGESLKTAQAILGHSDLETTLNTYMHAIPDSQRRAMEKVAEVLCPVVPNLAGAIPEGTVN
jgi:integrase